MPIVGVELPGVLLGVLEVEGVRVESSSSGLAMLIEKVAGELQRTVSIESLAEAESTQAVRAMFRVWGVDPSKYRPSSEALRRRVVQGKGLHRVSNVVDIGNLGSIETGWPYGLYDRARIVPPISFRHGKNAEVYEGIGKRMWHLAGRPVLADANGPFGSPISDSTRTMITESANRVLGAIYAPVNTPRASIARALSQLGERLVQFAAARVTSSGLCSLNFEPD
ncbi:MAG: B3/B4 domain-containing protein [Candidatus Acidiferrales bacterium]